MRESEFDETHSRVTEYGHEYRDAPLRTANFDSPAIAPVNLQSFTSFVDDILVNTPSRRSDRSQVLAESAADDLVALPVAVAVASPPANAEIPTGTAVLGNTADSSDADNRNSRSLFANKFVREALDFGYRQTIMN